MESDPLQYINKTILSVLTKNVTLPSEVEKSGSPLFGEDKRICFDFRCSCSPSQLFSWQLLSGCVVLTGLNAPLAVAAAGGELFTLDDVTLERVAPVFGAGIPFTWQWPGEWVDAWETALIQVSVVLTELILCVGLCRVLSLEVLWLLSDAVACITWQSFSMCVVLMWKFSSSYETPDSEQKGQAISFSRWLRRRCVFRSASDRNSSQQMSHVGIAWTNDWN